ncbi:MAG: hypothetical protein WBA13_09575 [Microcoleaceae cyanobacterium]
MATNFRNRYPNGSLISELLAIDHGKFIVRVLVQVEEVILATGLAAAETVELAEDQARKRALDLLGSEIVISSDQPIATVYPHLQTSPAPIPETAVTQPEEFAMGASRENESSAQSAPTEDWLSATDLTPDKEKQSLKKDSSIKAGSASLPPFPLNSPEVSENEYNIPAVSATRPISPTASVSRLDYQDFSDDIAKTDIQLKRLGWTNEQGAAHLQKTYGKRSRSRLSEEELLDFLNYLESLDTPISSDEI